MEHDAVVMEHDAVVERRLAFLLAEAQSPNPTYDQVVVYALRALSNHFSVGRDGSSGHIKLINRRMSRQALELLLQCQDEKTWCAETINEHREPLSQVWAWIQSSNSITADDIAKRLRTYPMVTITKDEDKKLRDLGQSCKGLPEERYEGIEIVIHEEEPKNVLKKNRYRRDLRR
jgi:hypothetical protein